MLSRFHVIPERNRRTDGRTNRQTDGRTDLLYQYRASVCCRAIKTETHNCTILGIRPDYIRWRIETKLPRT